MSKIRWSNVDGVQVSKLFFGNMYYFEYLADVSEIYFDSFPLIFVMGLPKSNDKGKKYVEGINFHHFHPRERISLFRTMSRFFTNNIITDEDEDDNDLDEIISKVYDNSTKTKEEEMEELEKSLKKIPNDTLLRAREFKKVMFSSRKYRLARVAFRRYNLNNINSRIIRILPQQWYDAIVETPQRFFTGNRGKIKGERVWRESIIKSRRI
ncbi:MAG: hypothetical protein HOB59_03520 [Gammaproteobacteria bacterium]|nr:hypothetical protein [Gammaproteobacteria bacterium]